jgi:hypothetical protein
MKKSLITTLVAVPLLALSSMAMAAEPVPAEPILLSADQMDGVTAGAAIINLGQWNISPITVIQLNVLNFGGAINLASIASGNVGFAFQ